MCEGSRATEGSALSDLDSPTIRHDKDAYYGLNAGYEYCPDVRRQNTRALQRLYVPEMCINQDGQTLSDLEGFEWVHDAEIGNRLATNIIF